MLIIDDILLAPFKGLLWTFRKIQAAAQNEIDAQRTRIRSDLSELYMQLDTGRISEEEFDAQEKQLLDRLDRLKETSAPRKSPPEQHDESGE